MAKRHPFNESAEITRVRVRLRTEPAECARLDALMVEHHNLKSAHLAGQTLRYVAELDGQWVALCAFGAAALQINARDKLIGWSPRQRARRLSLVVNNHRFCRLTERRP